VGVYHLRGSHLNLIARQHARYSIRGGTGLVFTFLTLVTGLIIASVFIDSIGNIQKSMERSGEKSDQKQVMDQVVNEIGRPAVKWAIGGDATQTTYLVDKKPALVSAVLIVLLFALPFLAAMGSFNQLSGDIGSKGLRYLLPRTERANLFFGRFIGTYIFVLLVLALLMAVVLLYLVLKAKLYPAGDVTWWMLRGYLAMAILALPYVAFCSWFSAMIDQPFGTFAVTQAGVGIVPFLVAMAPSSVTWTKYLNYVMPWPWRYDLLHPSPVKFLTATAVMLGFTAAFLFLGARHFQKRDL
jgi:hypothetical protein